MLTGISTATEKYLGADASAHSSSQYCSAAVRQRMPQRGLTHRPRLPQTPDHRLLLTAPWHEVEVVVLQHHDQHSSLSPSYYGWRSMWKFGCGAACCHDARGHCHWAKKSSSLIRSNRHREICRGETQRREICRRSSKREIYVSNIRILRTTAQWSQKVTDQKIIGLGERPRTRHETDATKTPKKSKESRVLDPKPHTYSRPAVVLQVALRRQ